ncbi:hypothetical protein ACH49O_40725 [Streptomyces coeruleorubidus]|uniref:hypothetical protein n=1 Tax=Streptomyces coeruleorubidus TaxID=116188 RepID=UPI0033DAA49A
MARTTRRYAFHRVNASLLAAALVFPAGLTGAVTALQAPSASGTDVPAQTTPPPEPTVTEPPPSTPSDTTPPPPTASEPTDTSSSGGTPPPDSSDNSSDTGDTEQQGSDPPAEQTKQIEDVTTSLNETKDGLPEELAATVDELTTTLEAVAAPETSLQDRQEVIESAQQLTTALTTIGGDGASDELREQLGTLVQQVSSTLMVGHDPEVPPEERSFLLVVVKRTTSALDMICDPETPEELRGHLIAVVDQLNYVLESSWDGELVRSFAMLAGSSVDWITAPETPPEVQNALAESTRKGTEKLVEINGLAASQEDRAKTRQDPEEELKKQAARMSDQQQRAASAHDQPDESLSEAAMVCTSAIFESEAESNLIQQLGSLIPENWGTEGVKDFWKAEVQGDELLDVLAQLQNDERVRAPFEIPQLITELADLVPGSELLGTLGKKSLYCRETASVLDQDFGITAGTWLAESDAG